MPVGSALANSDVVAVQLERVLPLTSKWFEVEDALISMFKGKITDYDVSTRNMRIPIPIYPGGKFRQTSADGGDWGRGSANTYIYGEMAPIFTVEAIEYTSLVGMATDSKVKAVANIVTKLAADGMQEYKTNLDRLLQTAGNGVLCTITGSPSGQTITGDSSFGTQLLRYNNTYGFFDTSLATFRGYATVTSINTASGTATFDSLPAGVVDTDKIVVEGLTSASPVSLFGLPYQDNSSTSGTWLGLTRSSYPALITPEIAAGGSGITPNMPQQLQTKMMEALGQDIFDTGDWIYYTHPRQISRWLKLMQGIAEISLPYGGGNKEIDMAFSRKSVTKVAGVTAKTSINASKTRWDMLDLNNWVRGTYQETTILPMAGLQKIPVYAASGGFGSAELFYIGGSQQIAVLNTRRAGFISNLAYDSF